MSNTYNDFDVEYFQELFAHNINVANGHNGCFINICEVHEGNLFAFYFIILH